MTKEGVIKDLKSLTLDEIKYIKEHMNEYIEEAVEKTKPKQYTTSSDGGCILIGNENWQIKIFNGYGDGENIILVYESPAAFYKDFERQKPIQDMIINGTFSVYSYDCLSEKQIKDGDKTIVTLTGKYNAYVYKGDFYMPPKLVLVKY